MMSDVELERDGDGDLPRRRPWVWIAVFAGVGVVGLVLVWFQPQKLFIDERVDEAIPTVGTPPATSVDGDTPPSTATPTVPAPPPEPIEVARGEFISLDHRTSGVARVLELADGTRIVRVEGLDTDNGPDLFLYLTANPAGGDEGAFDDEFLDLGRLKGNQGDQNYDLPADADLTQLQTIVIWCDRFDSAFGAADLMVRAEPRPAMG